MQFPNIDPVILPIGPFAISWYSLSYVAGVIIGWIIINKIIDIQLSFPKNSPSKLSLTKKNIEDYITWVIIGIIIGGRIGYVFFYNPEKYLNNPIEILKTYEGGMSFHGGITGFIIITYLFCKKHKIKFFELTDLCSIVAPIGLFFGRIANFINAELYGKVTTMPWGIIFPYSDGLPRHPSQLYEAALEGLILFIIMFYSSYKFGILSKNYVSNNIKINSKTPHPLPNTDGFKYSPGRLSGIFLFFYANFRSVIEFFREPDITVGYIYHIFTMGQLLCLPMILLGLYLFMRPVSTSNF